LNKRKHITARKKKTRAPAKKVRKIRKIDKSTEKNKN
jgi:hypothetical protein